MKDTEPAELLQAWRVITRGEALLSPAVTRRLISEFVARPPDAVSAAGMERLTNREREVVAMVAHGLSNDEIAAAMVLSPTTAKTHVSRAMVKLGARDRAQLAVYAFVTGQAISNGNALMLLAADGKTPYFPASPSAPGSPLAVDCAIPLNSSGGAPITITVPQLAGARLWFSIGTPITFLLNPGPGLVEPSVTNSSDPNIDIQWDFAEFTYNSAELFANISMVDFACIPIGLTLTDTSGNTQAVNGLPAGGLDAVCSGLTAQQ